MPIPIVEPSEREIAGRIRSRVQRVSHVRQCVVDVTSMGKKPNIRVRVWLDGELDYEKIHGISSTIDHVTRSVVPDARVSIRSEPEMRGEDANERLWELVKRTAEHEPGSRGAHNIHLQNLDGKLGVDFHLEVSARMSVQQAHDVATRIEKKLKAANPKISEVIIHEETAYDRVSSERSGHGSELRWYIDHIVKRFPDVRLASPPVVRRLAEGQLHVILRAAFRPDMNIETANQVTSKLETAIRKGYPRIARVDITHEPAEGKRDRTAES